MKDLLRKILSENLLQEKDVSLNEAPEDDLPPIEDDEVQPEENPEEQEFEEPQEEAAVIDFDKLYLGKTKDINFYLIANKNEYGEVEDLEITDAEGNKLYSAKENNLDIQDVPGFIETAINEVEIAQLETNVVKHYLVPKAEEIITAEDEEEENPEDNLGMEEPEEENPEATSNSKDEIPRESRTFKLHGNRYQILEVKDNGLTVIGKNLATGEVDELMLAKPLPECEIPPQYKSKLDNKAAKEKRAKEKAKKNESEIPEEETMCKGCNRKVSDTTKLNPEGLCSKCVKRMPKWNESKVNEDESDLDSQVRGDKLVKDRIPGGLADKNKPEDFDQAQLDIGIEIEMEHTSDPEIAREIAMDHLTEDPEYYTHLRKMEMDAKKNESKIKESYGNVYIQADLDKGMSEEAIIQKIQDRYPDIDTEQAKEIIQGVKSGKGGGWNKKSAKESKETNESRFEKLFSELKRINPKLSDDEILDKYQSILHPVDKKESQQTNERKLGVDYVQRAKANMRNYNEAMKTKDLEKAALFLEAVADEAQDGARAIKKMKLEADEKAAIAKEKELAEDEENTEIQDEVNEEAEEKDGKIEAYGTKGMKNIKWRKTFNSRKAMNAWAEKNDADIEGTRDLDESHISETTIQDPKGNSFSVNLVNEGDHDVILQINKREFRFEPDFAGMFGKDEAGKITDEGIQNLALETIGNLSESDYADLIASGKVEESKINEEDEDFEGFDKEKEYEIHNQLVQNFTEGLKNLSEEQLQKFYQEYIPSPSVVEMAEELIAAADNDQDYAQEMLDALKNYNECAMKEEDVNEDAESIKGIKQSILDYVQNLKDDSEIEQIYNMFVSSTDEDYSECSMKRESVSQAFKAGKIKEGSEVIYDGRKYKVSAIDEASVSLNVNGADVNLNGNANININTDGLITIEPSAEPELEMTPDLPTEELPIEEPEGLEPEAEEEEVVEPEGEEENPFESIEEAEQTFIAKGEYQDQKGRKFVGSLTFDGNTYFLDLNNSQIDLSLWGVGGGDDVPHTSKEMSDFISAILNRMSEYTDEIYQGNYSNLNNNKVKANEAGQTGMEKVVFEVSFKKDGRPINTRIMAYDEGDVRQQLTKQGVTETEITDIKKISKNENIETNESKKDPKVKIRNKGIVVFEAKSSQVKDNTDHFPINSKAQARNALSRINEYTSTPKWYSGSLSSLRDTVIQAVGKKYPFIKKEIEILENKEAAGGEQAVKIAETLLGLAIDHTIKDPEDEIKEGDTIQIFRKADHGIINNEAVVKKIDSEKGYEITGNINEADQEWFDKTFYVFYKK